MATRAAAARWHLNLLPLWARRGGALNSWSRIIGMAFKYSQTVVDTAILMLNQTRGRRGEGIGSNYDTVQPDR